MVELFQILGWDNTEGSLTEIEVVARHFRAESNKHGGGRAQDLVTVGAIRHNLNFRSRAFSVSTPIIWNTLPPSVRHLLLNTNIYSKFQMFSHLKIQTCTYLCIYAHIGWRQSSVGRMSVFGSCPLPDLWLTGDHFVGKLSAIGQPTRLTTNSVFHPSGVGKWVVIRVFTWITEVKTIKTADLFYVRLYDYRPKSVTVGLGCGLGGTPALSVTTAPLRRHMRQLWRYINEHYLYLYLYAKCIPELCWIMFDKGYRHDECNVRVARLYSISVWRPVSSINTIIVI